MKGCSGKGNTGRRALSIGSTIFPILAAAVLLLLVSMVLGKIGSVLPARPYWLFGGQQDSPALYRDFVDTAHDCIFDPRVLGDWSKMEHKFDSKLHNTEDAVQCANQALAVAGDPYTFVLDAQAVKVEHEQMRGGGFCGVGVYLTISAPKSKHSAGRHVSINAVRGNPVVMAVIEGGPAEKGGIEADDVIETINGHPTSGLTLIQSSMLIRGEIGTKVELGLRRHGKSLKITLVRQIVKLIAVKSAILPNNIGYIRIVTFFQTDVSDLVRNAISQEINCRAYIFDVRDDGGGFLDQAVDCASQVIQSGIVMTAKERVPGDGYTTETWPRRGYSRLGSKPVVLLVNGHSASASEIFAGALKDNYSATLIGENTFGKGIVQRIIPMPNGCELHVTIARYYSPSGTWFGDGASHRIGIKPDIVVKAAPKLKIGSSNDNQLQRAESYLQKILSRSRP